MNALRIEADESASKAEEMQAKVKTLEQENLQKEQEVTSLQHKLSVAEGEVEKMEEKHKSAKAAADESAQHGTQNESLTRKVQVLEEEAEEHDRLLRETNEKYGSHCSLFGGCLSILLILFNSGSARRTSRPVITSARCKLSRPSATNGNRNTRRWQRNTPTPRRNWTILWPRLVTSKPFHPALHLILAGVPWIFYLQLC